METVATICAYCGCGCRLLFEVEKDKIVRVLPDKTDGPSEGIACIKGLTIHEVAYSGTILKPMIRTSKSSSLPPTTR